MKLLIENFRQFIIKEEIEEIWSGSWAGKIDGNPFIVRGGYNCRHRFRAVF